MRRLDSYRRSYPLLGPSSGGKAVEEESGRSAFDVQGDADECWEDGGCVNGTGFAERGEGGMRRAGIRGGREQGLLVVFSGR